MNFNGRLIVIAAGAGGMEAVSRILAALPSNFPAAIAVVVRADDRSVPHAPDFLKSHTRLRLGLAADGDQLTDGQVFFAPPKRYLAVQPDGRLRVNSEALHGGQAGDELFITAAKVAGCQVIGVVLTGGGSDGSAGIIAIEKAGGKSVVQSPSDAGAPGMPINAIMFDSPDHVVLLDEIAPLLRQLVEQRTSD